MNDKQATYGSKYRNALLLIDNSIALKDFQKARKQALVLLANYPNDFDLLNTLAVIEASDCHYLAAVEFFEKALVETDILLAKIDIYRNITRSYELASDYSKAATSYRQCLSLDPELVDIWFGLAQNLTVIGDSSEAITAYRQVIRLSTISRHGLFRTTAFNAISQNVADEKLLNTMLSEVSQTRQKEDQISLLFAIATMQDKLQQYDSAFGFFQRANKLKAESLTYNAKQVKKQSQQLIDFFNKDFFELRSAKTSDKETNNREPIFIVGLPRSGTTLIESILSQDEKIFAAGEVDYIPQIISEINLRDVNRDGYPSLLNKMNFHSIKKLQTKYLSKFENLNGKRIVDKLPANFWNVGLIKLIFPNAKIICCQKNPFDACFSLYKQNFQQGHEYAYSLENCADYYQTYQQLMNHWQDLFADDIVIVNYEEFVSQPEKIIEDIFDNCDLLWRQKYLASFSQRDAVRTASSFQIREGINNKSTNRWKKYQKHLDQLISRFEYVNK